jgi:putative ATPase
MAAQQAVHFLGLPEGKLALAELTVYLALAPKSNAIYRAYGAVRDDVERTRNDPVPLHLRNAVTGLMRGLGYGRGYEYAHDVESGVSAQEHLPENLRGRVYYVPTGRGFEARLAERQQRIRESVAAQRDAADA